MKPKGWITRDGLHAILREIADLHSTGVLMVDGPQGHKSLEIRDGDISISVSGRGNYRLGDLLIARGKINDSQLKEALAKQREASLKLGDVLCEMELVTKGDIEKALTFQMHEEICDLLTWREGQYEFEEGKTLSRLLSGQRSSQIRVVAKVVLNEATKRAGLWKDIELTVPSAHMVFTLTPRGEKVLQSASPGGRRLLELVRDSHDVASIVRHTSVGRFQVSKALSELVRATAIDPVLDAELPIFTDELVRANRYVQAIGCYQRMLELEQDPAKRQDLTRAISAAEEALEIRGHIDEQERRAPRRTTQAIGDLARKSRARKQLLTVAAGVAAVLVGGLFLAVLFRYQSLQEKVAPESPEAFQTAASQAEQHAAADRHAKAVAVLKEFLAEHPDSKFAGQATERIEKLRERIALSIRAGMGQARELVGRKQFDEALEVLHGLQKRFAKFPRVVSDVDQELKIVRQVAGTYARDLGRQKLRQLLDRAQALYKQKRYSEALSQAQKVLAQSPPSGPKSAKSTDGGSKPPADKLAGEAQKLVAAIEKLGAQAKAHYVNGQRLEQSDLETAWEAYAKAVEIYERGDWGRKAKQAAFTIERKQIAAKRLFDEAGRLEKSQPEQAVARYLEIQNRYKGTKVWRQASERGTELAKKVSLLAALLTEARALEERGDADGAWKRFLALFERFGDRPEVRALRLTIRIESHPTGAQVRRDGRDLGTTPLEVTIGAFERAKLVVEFDGYESRTLTFDRVRERVHRVELAKTTVFKSRLQDEIMSGCTVVDGRLYVAAGVTLYALDARNGQVLWSRAVGRFAPTRSDPDLAGGQIPVRDRSYWNIRAAPVVFKNRVCAVSRDGYLYLINTADGSVARRVNLGCELDSTPVLVENVLMRGRTVAHVAGRDGTLRFVDLEAGLVRQKRAVGAPVELPLIRAGRLAVVANAKGTVLALDLTTGRPVWSHAAGAPLASAPAVRGNRLAIVNEQGDLQVLNVADGRILFQKTFAGVGAVRLGFITAHTLAITGQDQVIRCYSFGRKEELWAVDLDGPPTAGPVSDGNLVFVGTDRGSFYCLDATQQGAERWRLRAEQPIRGVVRLSGSNVYFTDVGGTVYAVKIK